MEKALRLYDPTTLRPVCDIRHKSYRRRAYPNSFPSDILFSINFPSCLPGKMGEKGEKGKTGKKGLPGLQGQRGPNGPFGLCPT